MGLTPDSQQNFCGADIQQNRSVLPVRNDFLLLPVLYLSEPSLAYSKTSVNPQKP